MAYQDEKGHFTTKENDGGPCHHGSGNGPKKKKYDSRGKSLYDFDKENPGEGSHNQIIDKLRNSGYDSVDEAMKDAERYNLTDEQKEYVHEYAKHVFGEEFDDDYEEEFEDDFVADEDKYKKYLEEEVITDEKVKGFIEKMKNGNPPVNLKNKERVKEWLETRLDDEQEVEIALNKINKLTNPGNPNNSNARPHETKLHDLNLNDSELWNMAYKYIGNDKLEKLAEQLDFDSPQDIPTSELIKYMSDDDIADMLNYNGYDEQEDFNVDPEVDELMDNVAEQDKAVLERQKQRENLNPNNPKYKGFNSSDITNAKLVDEGKTVHDYDKNKDIKFSIIEYIPYGALQRGDNRKLYGVVSDYDGSDTPDIGAIVSPSLESAREDLESQIQLAEQGSERYLGRGKWDKGWFDMLNDKEYEWDEETKKHYSDKYGWDYSKPWEEQAHVKGSKPGSSNKKPIPKDPNFKVKKKKNGTYEVPGGASFPNEKSLIDVYGELIKKYIVDED